MLHELQKKMCIEGLKGVNRSAVHVKFWEMSYNERKSWIAAHVKMMAKQVR